MEEKTVEKLEDADKQALDNVRGKLELAVANAKNADLTYQNVLLQLALKYKLQVDDQISDQGEIIRKTSDTKEGS